MSQGFVHLENTLARPVPGATRFGHVGQSIKLGFKSLSQASSLHSLTGVRIVRMHSGSILQHS